MGATMHFHFRDRWLELKRGQPGHRFQQRYARAREEAHEGHWGERIVLFVAAIISMLIGVVLVIIPGPALPFFFISGGLLASESRTIARFMDWLEVVLRKLGRWGRARWRRLPKPVRLICLGLGTCLSVGATYLTYRFLRH
jgi:hypothetical protein